MGEARLKKCPVCGEDEILEEVAIDDYPLYDDALLKRKRKVDLTPPIGFKTRRAFKKQRLADKKMLNKKRRLNEKRRLNQKRRLNEKGLG